LLSFGAESFVFQFAIQTSLKINIYINITWPVLYDGCETWSLTLKEERGLRVFENRVLRIFGPKRDKLTGKWNQLYNEELNDLYSSPNIIWLIKWRRMRWTVHVARMEGREIRTTRWWGNPRERDHLEDPGVDGRIILR
jgi:hypothetical protein